MTTDNHCSVPSLFFREKIRVEKSAVYLPITSARYLGHTKALLLIGLPEELVDGGLFPLLTVWRTENRQNRRAKPASMAWSVRNMSL